MRSFLFFCFLLILTSCKVQGPALKLPGYEVDKLIFKDAFDKLSARWIVETPAHKNSRVVADKNKLVIDVAAGATVWLDEKLEGGYLIEFTRKVLVDSGVNDRLSDLNVFWMAKDPKNVNTFTRSGVFEEYDSLSLYYVGMGGNTNSTTRFRKYYGDGRKPLLQEHLDKAHLLESNRDYRITLTVKNGLTEFFVDGVKFFSYQDPQPLKEGYFGFRTTWSRHEIRDFKIYSLK